MQWHLAQRTGASVALVLGMQITYGLAAASARTRPFGASLQTATYRIETDRVLFNLDSGVFTMPDTVRFYRPGTQITGDRAEGNVKARVVVVIGHVVVHDDGASAQDADLRTGAPSTMTSDRLTIDDRRQRYVALGNLRYVQGRRTALAGRGDLDRRTHVLRLSGNVVLNEDAMTIHADSVRYNSQTSQAYTEGHPLIIHQMSSR